MERMTAMMVDFFGEAPYRFVILRGDQRRFDGVFINLAQPPERDARSQEDYEKAQNELNNLLYDEDGNFKPYSATRDEFVQAIRHGADMINVGFVP